MFHEIGGKWNVLEGMMRHYLYLRGRVSSTGELNVVVVVALGDTEVTKRVVDFGRIVLSLHSANQLQRKTCLRSDQSSLFLAFGLP